MNSKAIYTRHALCWAAAILGCSTHLACGSDDGNARPVGAPLAPATVPSPVPTPPLPPPPPPPDAATPGPFKLTQSRTFDVLGWDSWPSAPTPSAFQFRWDAAIGQYEVLAPGYPDWNRLEVREGRLHEYDVFGSGGTKLPLRMLVSAPPDRWPADGYVGEARIFEGAFPQTVFAFGIATEPSDVPVGGTMTCSFAEDEIGEGRLTFDLAAGTVAGWAEPFWVDVRYELVQTSFARGATAFALKFGTDGVLEGRFFGPRAVNVAVRALGGGKDLAAVRGIMLGVCKS